MKKLVNQDPFSNGSEHMMFECRCCDNSKKHIMSDKIYMVRMADNDEEFEALFHTLEEAESFAKRCVQTHNESAIIHEFKLINTITLEK